MSIGFYTDGNKAIGEYHGTFYLNDEPVPAMFEFVSQITWCGDTYLSKNTAVTAVIVRGINILPIINLANAWAAAEDDIDGLLFAELSKLAPAEHSPNGEGYHQAVAA